MASAIPADAATRVRAEQTTSTRKPEVPANATAIEPLPGVPPLLDAEDAVEQRRVGLLVARGVPGERHNGGHGDDPGGEEEVVEAPGPPSSRVQPEADGNQGQEVEEIPLLGLLEGTEETGLDDQRDRQEQRHRAEHELSPCARARQDENEPEDRAGNQHEPRCVQQDEQVHPGALEQRQRVDPDVDHALVVGKNARRPDCEGRDQRHGEQR